MPTIPKYYNHLFFLAVLTLFLYRVTGRISRTASLALALYLVAYGLLPSEFWALWGNLAFYHLSLLTFILGAQIYQSFLANITASRALTLAQFRALQPAIWTMYFRMQMLVSVLLALTYPGDDGGGGTADALLFPGPASVRGVFFAAQKEDRWSVLLPLTGMFVFSGLNVLYVAPETIRLQHKLAAETAHEENVRRNSETPSRAEKSTFDTVRDPNAAAAAEKSPALQATTNHFLRFHLLSYGCNMATIGASLCYAVCVAMRGLEPSG